MITKIPADERDIDEELVRGLLRDQHPDFAEMPIQFIDSGWDNVIYRLGESHAVRLPRRKEAAVLAEHEQTWLPVLANRLPIPVPSPVRIGRSSNAYPWPWSIIPWLPGNTADLTPPADDQSRPLAEFLRALHHSAPANAPKNPLRGVPLDKRAKTVEDRLDRLREFPDLNVPQLLDVWKLALDAPEANQSNWLHGDLHARNVIVTNGTITGVVDWGDITAGDVATDLASVWMLFREQKARLACLEYYQARPALLARSKGWAVFFGSMLLETGLVDHPRHAAMGEATLRRVAEDSAVV